MSNKLIIAAAGSGKTTYIVKEACAQLTSKILITTYTEANETEIRRSIIKYKGYMPSNITVQTWFSFLLQHGVRPYQSVLNEDIHEKNIGFYLDSKKTGARFDSNGNQLFFNKRPMYWGEKDFLKFYFTKSLKIYSDKVSKFVFNCNKETNGEVVNRISRIFDYVFIDEVQDLAGFDLELIKLFFKSDSHVTLVGDPRQVTYLTHPSSKFKKYSDGKIKQFVENELGKRIKCDVDESSLNSSHRNNQKICDYSAKLYPSHSAPNACECISCRCSITDHEGVFLIKPKDVNKYLSKYHPMQLRWNAITKCNSEFEAVNFGQSKGLSFDRVLIYPTKPMGKWIRDNSIELKNEAKAKLYVAITRSRKSVAIVVDFENDNIFEGLEKYSANDI